MSMYSWRKSFFGEEEDDVRPEKPRRYGVTEMRGPNYTLLTHNLLQDTFESMGQFVDGLKFTGGSNSMIAKGFIKDVTNMAHKHNVYVSTGDWAEHLLRKGPSGFKEYIEECKQLGFDTVELKMGSLDYPEDTLLRFVRLIKSAGLKVKPQFSVKFRKSDIPATGNRAFGSYVVPTPQTSGMETISSILFTSNLMLEKGPSFTLFKKVNIYSISKAKILLEISPFKQAGTVMCTKSDKPSDNNAMLLTNI